MKRTLIIYTVLSVFAGNGFAQGAFNFQANSANGFIQYTTDDVTTAPYPLSPGLPYLGNAHVGFFTAPNGTILAIGASGAPDFTGWTANSIVLNIANADGRTLAQSITVANAANNVNVSVEVVGWTGTATSWAQAMASGNGVVAWSGETFRGSQFGALGWSQPTGDPTKIVPDPPASLVTGAGGYQGLIFENGPFDGPEPSTIALGGLGAAILGLSRFLRKRQSQQIRN